MALNPSGAISLAGPVAGESIALELGLSPTAVISLNDTAVRTLAGVPSGTIIMPTNFWGKSAFTPTQKAIFAFGVLAPGASNVTNVSNLVSNTGVVASNSPGVGTSRYGLGSSTYGGDKAIFGFGDISSGPAYVAMTNLVSNTGVVAADTPGVGSIRRYTAGAAYGTDKGMFAFGISGPTSLSDVNYVSNTGVVASNSPSIATARNSHAGAIYGGDKAIFALGSGNLINLVSNTGVVAATTTSVGTARRWLAGSTYGGDKAIFGYGRNYSTPSIYYNITNLVSNTGVFAANSSGVGTSRSGLAAAPYGGDKALFGFGGLPSVPGNVVSVTNLVSNTGSVAGDNSTVATAKTFTAGAGYSLS